MYYIFGERKHDIAKLLSKAGIPESVFKKYKFDEKVEYIKKHCDIIDSRKYTKFKGGEKKGGNPVKRLSYSTLKKIGFDKMGIHWARSSVLKKWGRGISTELREKLGLSCYKNLHLIFK